MNDDLNKCYPAMTIEEAKIILEQNGYVLEEGKFGKMLAAGAIAAAGLFGQANASDICKRKRNIFKCIPKSSTV